MAEKRSKEEIKEAHRIAKDLQEQVIEANRRLITGRDVRGRTPPSAKSDEFVRKTGNLLENKLVQKYREGIAKDYSSAGDFSTYDLKSNPDYYRR